MSYQQALEAAGATVSAFIEAGDYQGTWFARIGPDQWVTGSYGSCSGCDAFQAEFDCCREELPDYQSRLAAFGQQYLDDVLTAAQAIALANNHWNAGDAKRAADDIETAEGN